jgi:Holliday junction resolvase RusA-like endonuclease
VTGRRFAFTVPFVAGKQRHRLDRRHARMYTPNETIRNEAAIRDAALGAMREAYPELKGLLFPFRVPVAVRIDVYDSLPKSRPKRTVSEPNTFKPDADNIAKLVMDGMNGVVWGDDSQVAEVHVVKWPRRRGIEPHMDIQVYRGWADPAEDKK